MESAALEQREPVQHGAMIIQIGVARGTVMVRETRAPFCRSGFS
jgi:hypothetical protein